MQSAGTTSAPSPQDASVAAAPQESTPLVKVEAAAPQDTPLVKGEAVRAFYHANDHPGGYRFVRLLDGPPPEVSPEVAPNLLAIGLSTGWIPATVVEDWNPPAVGSTGDGRVLVKLHGRFLDAYKSEGPEPANGMFWRVSRDLVRRMGQQRAPAELSLLIVRYWDYWSANRRSPSHNVTNEEMLLNVVEREGSPHAAFGAQGRYEVHSAFVRSSADLELIGNSVATAMRGTRKAALYFLWPTQRPAVEKRMPGCYSEPAVFAMMERMESLGVGCYWPHPRRLYRELSGKLWIPRMSRERQDLKVPPTISVVLEDFNANPFEAAERALSQLVSMRALPEGGSIGTEEEYRGVAKLGFSWMGEDVKPFTGVEQLVKVLTQLFDGAIEGTVCLVQQRVENVVCEYRSFCFRDLAAGSTAVQRELVRMKLHQPKHNDPTFALTSHRTMTALEATNDCFRGSAEAQSAAESQVQTLVDSWLQWFRDEGFGVPASCRLDFLVSVAPGSGAVSSQDVHVWTVELCEMGGSLCNLPCIPRAVVCLNQCICGDVAMTDSLPRGFPQPLPSLKPIVQDSWQDRPWQRSGGPNATRNTAGSSRMNQPLAQQTRQQQQLRRIGVDAGDNRKRPFTAILARLGIGEAMAGRAILSVIIFLVLTWFRLRRRR